MICRDKCNSKTIHFQVLFCMSTGIRKITFIAAHRNKSTVGSRNISLVTPLIDARLVGMSNTISKLYERSIVGADKLSQI